MSGYEPLVYYVSFLACCVGSDVHPMVHSSCTNKIREIIKRIPFIEVPAAVRPFFGGQCWSGRGNTHFSNGRDSSGYYGRSMLERYCQLL